MFVRTSSPSNVPRVVGPRRPRNGEHPRHPAVGTRGVVIGADPIGGVTCAGPGVHALAGRPGRVFFANSGAEANEAAFKLSRLTGRTHVVATHGGFHGRTMGALALTGQPAKLFGLKNRGLLREGYAADLMLFDPKTVARGPKRREHDLPAGAARLTTSAVGLHGVWINGAKVADDKGICADPKARPGEVIRDFAS